MKKLRKQISKREKIYVTQKLELNKAHHGQSLRLTNTSSLLFLFLLFLFFKQRSKPKNPLTYHLCFFSFFFSFFLNKEANLRTHSLITLKKNQNAQRELTKQLLFRTMMNLIPDNLLHIKTVKHEYKETTLPTNIYPS